MPVVRSVPVRLGLIAAGVLLACAVQAQGARLSLDQPAQPLDAALSQVARQAGVQVLFAAAATQGKTAAALRGQYTVREALEALLAGSGLVLRAQDDKTYTVEPAPPGATGAEALLPAVTARASLDRETANGPVQGYVARRSATATKVDSAIVESPQSIAVVTRDQMDAQGAQSVSDALRYTAGVLAEANGPDPRADYIVIRGFDANGRDQYRDGLRTYAFNNQAGTVIEPYGLERVEILRGPSSILYGQSGPGGMVNLVSKRPTDTPLHELQLQLGSHDRRQVAGDFGGPLTADGTWSYRLTALARDSDTQIDHVKDDRVFVAPALTWRPDARTSLTLMADYQKNERGQGYQAWPRVGTLAPNPNGRIPTSRFLGEPGFDRLDQDRYSVGYQFEHRFSDALAFRQNLRHLRAKSDVDTIYMAGLQADDRTVGRFGSAGREEIRNTAIDNHLQLRVGHGSVEHTLLLGIDKQWMKNALQSSFGAFPDLDVFTPVYSGVLPALTPDTDSRQRLEQTGAYVQDQIKIDRRWVATLGGRKDWTEQSTTDLLGGGGVTGQKDHAFTWRSGLVYLADNGWAPYASYAESFTPVLGTMAPGRGGQPFDPETGRQYELGLRYQPEGQSTSVTVSAFELRRQNVTTTDPLYANFSIQRGEVRSRGIEAEFKSQLTPRLNLLASAATTLLKITKSNDGVEGKVPSAVPKHTASVWIDYRLPVPAGLSVSAGVRYLGTSWGEETNAYKVPAYTLADVALRYDLSGLGPATDGWLLALNVSNLFDKTYVATCGYYADGCKYGYRRNAVATLSYRW